MSPNVFKRFASTYLNGEHIELSKTVNDNRKTKRAEQKQKAGILLREKCLAAGNGK
jgi:hypothetical protein